MIQNAKKNVLHWHSMNWANMDYSRLESDCIFQFFKLAFVLICHHIHKNEMRKYTKQKKSWVEKKDKAKTKE